MPEGINNSHSRPTFSGNVNSAHYRIGENRDNDAGYEESSFEYDDTFVGWLWKEIKGLWNDVTGLTAQEREFAQQEYLQDKMNLYNLPSEQMKRENEAGINGFMAAGAIAQGGSESAQAPQVSSNTQGVANGLGAVSNAVSQLSQLGAQIDNLRSMTHKNNIDALSSKTKLPFEVDLMRGRTYHELQSALKDKNQAMAFEIENYYRGDSLFLDIMSKRLRLPILRQTFKNLQKDFEVKEQEIQTMIQEVEESKSRVTLNEYEQNYKAALTYFTGLQSWKQERINEFMRDFNFDPTWPSTSILLGIAADDSIDDVERAARVDSILAILYNNSYSISEGDSQGSLDAKKGIIAEQGRVDKALLNEKARLDNKLRISEENRSLVRSNLFGTGKSMYFGPFGFGNYNQ